MPEMKIKEGQQWGRLTVLRAANAIRSRAYFALCRCACGQEKEIRHGCLSKGHTKSCGCLAKEETVKRSFIHGQSHSSAYYVWINMVRRCHDPHVKDFKHYGARGIRVCERWREFKNFFDDMGHRPEGRSIDRTNNDGNYEPSNCRWATVAEQLKNRRPRSRRTA